VPEAPLILVVEDDYPLQGVVEDFLREGGFETHAFSSGEEALTLFRGRVAEYRALVTEVAKQIREIAADFPVVYMTVRPPASGPLTACPPQVDDSNFCSSRALDQVDARQDPFEGLEDDPQRPASTSRSMPFCADLYSFVPGFLRSPCNFAASGVGREGTCRWRAALAKGNSYSRRGPSNNRRATDAGLTGSSSSGSSARSEACRPG
jgi:hypothetical protein